MGLIKNIAIVLVTATGTVTLGAIALGLGSEPVQVPVAAPIANTAPIAKASPVSSPVPVAVAKPIANPAIYKTIISDNSITNIRNAPVNSGMSDKVIGSAKPGDRLQIIRTVDVQGQKWDLVKFTDVRGNGDRGWVHQSRWEKI